MYRNHKMKHIAIEQVLERAERAKTIVLDAGANEVFIDCVDGGFLPPYYAGIGYEALGHKEITYPSGNTFPMVLMRKELNGHPDGPANGI
jgi:hypothetical protein